MHDPCCERNLFPRDKQFYKFSLYGFLKNLRFFDPFILLFFREVGFSFFQIGTLFAFREITTNILEIPTGVIADSYGRRRSMIFCFVAYILSFCIFYLFPSYIVYFPAMLLFAIGDAFRTGTHKAMILEYLRIKNIMDCKVHYYGHTRSWSQKGSAVSSLIAAALVFYTGSYRIIFLAATVPYALDLLLMISYPRELDGEIRKPDHGVSTLAFAAHQIPLTLKSFGQVFRNPGFLRAISNSSLFSAMFKVVKDYLQPIVRQYALLLPIFMHLGGKQRTAVLVGIVYFFLFLLSSHSAKSAGKLVDRVKSLGHCINLVFLAGTTFILLSGLSVHVKLYVPAILLFVLMYLVHNIKRPMNIGYISEKVTSQVMATGLSAESQLTSLFVAILAPLMGFLADRLGVGAALIAMGILLIVLLPAVAIRQSRDTQPGDKQ